MVTDLLQLQSKNWHANNPTAGTPNPGRPIPGTAILDEDTQTYVFSLSDRTVSFLQNRHVEEERETLTATLGGSLDVGRLNIDARLSHMDLSQDLPIWHQVNFQNRIGNPAPTVPSGFSCGMEIDPATNALTPGGTQVGTPGTCGILFGTWWPIDDPDQGPRLAQARVNGREVNDEATSAFLDFSYDLDNTNIGDIASTFTSVEFGVKYSDRTKDRFQNDVSAATEVAAGNQNAISNFASPFPYSDPWLGGEAGPGSVTQWIVPDIGASFDFLFPSGIPGTSPNPLQTWEVSEEVVALYVMVNFENANGKLFGNAGVRYVDTQIDAAGNSGITFRPPRPTYFTLLDSDCTSIQGQNCFVESPVNDSKSYSELLPSLNLNYVTSDDSLLRMAISRTMARPSFNDLRPNGNLDIRSFSESTFRGGNPLLNPLVSDNFDVSWEWYFGESNLLAAALFYKDMKDFVFTSTFVRQYDNPFTGEPFRDETQGLGPDGQFPFAEIVSTAAINGSAAEILGLELTYQQTFDDLLPWGGLGVLLNYTYADSEADYDDREGELDPYDAYPLLNTSEHTYNATVFFENERVAARLAYNWRSERLIAPDSRQMSTWADAIGSLDASFNINLTENVSLTGNAVNLTDEFPRQFQTVAFVNGNQPGVVVEGDALGNSLYEGRTSRLNYYGRTYRLGVRVTF
jgi:TonB-dependent receptor